MLGSLRFFQVCFLLALLIFASKELLQAPQWTGLFHEKEPEAASSLDIGPETTESATTTPAQKQQKMAKFESLELRFGDPFKVADEEPPHEEFAPVFIEETLMKRKDLRVCELEKWNWTVEDPNQAIFYIVCCGPVERFLELPQRTPERPYLCYDCDAKLQMGSLSGDDCLKHKNCNKNLIALLSRRDFMFSASDLREWNLRDDAALLLPGVTHVHHIPAPEKLSKNKVTPSDPPKYFLTFQGIRNVGKGGTSYVRMNLEAVLNTSTHPPPGIRGPLGEILPLPEQNFTLPSDVFIAIAAKAQHHKELRHYFSLFDSVYGLVLHGHGRWSYRLMEVLSGEAIPVILAEGWKLPLNELIDWEQISLQRPENFSCDPEALIESLPRDQELIGKMRERVRQVFGKFMSSQEKRLVGLLRAAALWKRNWQELEKGTLRMLADAAKSRS